tara:strand:+ start:31 stop:543 length:513 start_codon:yes stop_codon:yes gene_type:complete
MLEKQGETSPEEIAELKALAAQYKEANGLDGFAMGLVSNGWGLSDVINDKLGDDLFKSTGEAAMANASRKESIRQAQLKTSGGLEEARRLSKDADAKAKAAATLAKGDNRDTSWTGGKVAVNQTKPKRDKNPTVSASQANYQASKAAKKLGVKLATGGKARGGLMKKKKK